MYDCAEEKYTDVELCLDDEAPVLDMESCVDSMEEKRDAAPNRAYVQ